MTDIQKLKDLDVADWRPGAGDPVAVRRAAKSRKRGQQLWLAAGATATVGVLAVFPAVVLGGSPQSNDVTPGASTKPPATDLHVADGYRAVGALGLVFEVPETWGTNEVACDGWPVADTVGFGGTRSCMSARPRVSSLIITTRGNETVAAAVGDVPTSDGTVPGVDVAVGGPKLVDGLWTLVLATPSGEVGVVRTVDPAVGRHILDALRPIPDGWVIVPQLVAHDATSAEHELASLGLMSQVTDDVLPEPADIEPGSVLDAVDPGEVLRLTPPPASLVPAGSEVALVRATPRP